VTDTSRARSYAEHFLVENYFRTANNANLSYWIGLRQPGLGASP
jgi:hypothetical protein